MIELVPARLTHVGPIATRMREMDQIEAEAMGRTPKESLRLGLRASHLCWTALLDGRPAAMMGVASTSLINGKGIVWLLGTEDVYRSGRALVRLGPMVIGEMLKEFRVLENVVSTQNRRAIRMLRKWGFVIGGEKQTHRGVEFVPFRVERGPIASAPTPLSIQGPLLER